MRTWDLATRSELRRITTDHELYGAGLSPDRKTLVLSNGPVRVFDAATFEPVATLGDSRLVGNIYRLVVSPDSKLLATSRNDHGIHLWDLAGL